MESQRPGAFSRLSPKTMNFLDAFFVMVSVCLSTTLAAFTKSMRSVGSVGMEAQIEECKEHVAVKEVSYVAVLY